MRTITLEEHVVFPELAKRIRQQAGVESTLGSVAHLATKLADVTGDRIVSMDNSGIDMQVISVVGPGADLLSGENAIMAAVDYNNALADHIKDRRNRFAAFAHLPTGEPEAAAAELERTVTQYNFVGALINGMTQDKFLDAPEFAPILAKAEELDVPIYLHPGLPPKGVKELYYSNLPNDAGERLSVAGWGWHSETALHILRLIISGTLDKYPKLKLIIGHMGEMLPMMMVRSGKVFPPGQSGDNQRSIEQTLKDQVFITTSGLFTKPPLQVALDTFGIDNILFSIDYPFSTNEQGHEYLDSLDLSKEDMEKLCYRNAEKLLRL